MKFLCDQMLGSLARWLRLLGFDTYYADSEIDDTSLLEIAKKQKRVIITRDKELLIRAKKHKIQLIEINSINLDEQLKTLLKDKEINEKKVLTRCSLCNTLVVEINKEDVKNRVPEKVFLNNELFWYCSKCDKIYWRGSHYDKIINKMKIFSH